MKTYFLYFETLSGGKYTQRHDTPFAFMQAFEAMLDNRFTIENTVRVWTEERV